MTTIRKAKPRFPGTSVDDRDLLWAKVLRLARFQSAAAGATTVIGVLDQPMRVRGGYFVFQIKPDVAGPESVAIDLQQSPVGGGAFTTLLLALATAVNASTPGAQIPFVFTAAFETAGRILAAGTVLEIITTNPNPSVSPANVAVVELEPAS